MHSGIEGTLSSFADDPQLCGADMWEGRDSILERGLGRLERWDDAEFMKFNKATCNVLCVGQDNPKHKYRLSEKGIGSSPGESGSWGCP